MATHALLKRLVQQGVPEHFAITLVGEAPSACYDRVDLTQFFSGRTPEEL